MRNQSSEHIEAIVSRSHCGWGSRVEKGVCDQHNELVCINLCAGKYKVHIISKRQPAAAAAAK